MSSLSGGLSAIGLSDIRKVVRLMSLVAGGRVELPKTNSQPSNNMLMTSDNFNINTGQNLIILNELSNKLDPATTECLQTLSWAVSALADVDPDASKLVMNMCTKVWLYKN